MSDFLQFLVISGTLDFSPGYAVVLQETADTFDLQPGDIFDISYALPVPRQKGIESAAEVSTRRARTTLTVSGIALQRGVTGLDNNDGVLIDLDYARHWLNLPGQAERIVVAFDESVYNDNDPQAAAFQARTLAEEIQTILGESFDYNLPRATILSQTFEAFIFFQEILMDEQLNLYEKLSGAASRRTRSPASTMTPAASRPSSTSTSASSCR